LSEVVTNLEVVKILTSNAAVFLDRSDIGSLEPGKMADMVIVDGDPLADIANLGNIEIVIQSGRVVVDNR
jgi:imidazolonepropionase-like amidohydrolase